MELLLTGSTGFVGRNLLLKLLSDQQWSRVVLPVRNPEKLHLQLAQEGITGDKRLEIVKVSDDVWTLPDRSAPELFIHAAGRLFCREREGYFLTNVEGSLRLAAQLPAYARMIVLSSLAAGGPTPGNKASRLMDDPDAPVSHYGESKLAMEKALRARLGDRLLILRPPMVLGPRDGATVPLFQMAKGRLRVKPGLKQKQYSWIAVEDLCQALLRVAASEWPQDQKPYYLTAKEIITDSQLLSTAADVLKTRGVTLPVPQPLIQIVSRLLDAIPNWRETVPSLGRDRVREILPDRWVCGGTDFAKSFDWKPVCKIGDTLLATAEWLKLQRKI